MYATQLYHQCNTNNITYIGLLILLFAVICYYNDYTVKDGRIEIFYDERYLSLYKPGIKTIV